MVLFGKRNYKLTALSPDEQSEMRSVLYDFAFTIPFARSAPWGISREEAQLALDHANAGEMTKNDIKMAINCMNGYLIWMEQKNIFSPDRKKELQTVLPDIRKKLEAILK